MLILLPKKQMISSVKIKKASNKIYWTKIRLLCIHGFYGYLLSGLEFKYLENYNDSEWGIGTDGNVIYVDIDKILSYSEKELEILLMHEILHIVLKHTQKTKKKNDPIFNRACDLVVNSNIS